MSKPISVTVWNEFRHENESSVVAEIYPKGMHAAIAEHLGAQEAISVKTATLDQPQHGLTDETLAQTDVLIWWGHMAHDEVADETVDKVQRRVLEGMGLVVLHSGHASKIFKRLMGTSCGLIWREVGEREILWVTSSAHPIVEGIDSPVILEQTEMYGERFDIPEPMETVLIANETSNFAHTPSSTTSRCSESSPTPFAGPSRPAP